MRSDSVGGVKNQLSARKADAAAVHAAAGPKVLATITADKSSSAAVVRSTSAIFATVVKSATTASP
jgi:hypothetical protein